MSPIPSALAEALLPRYRLGELIAEGGQAMVVRARDITLDRDVALKLLPRANASAVAVQRFLREMHLLAELAHPYIIPILDAGEAADILWYAMPLLRGTTLAARLSEGPVPVTEVRRWGGELAEALAVAHARGVVHRDVKPANIHLVNGHALLADFGVAALVGDDSLTSTGEAVGTRRYMAPEQRSGEASPQSDVYGLGVSLVEAVTGRQWSGTTEWSSVPRGLRAPLRRALSERPAARWSSPGAFAAALNDHAWPPWPRVAAVLGVAAGLIAVTWSLRPDDAPRQFVADVQVTGFSTDELSQRLARAIVTRLEWFPPLLVAPWHSAPEQITAKWRVEGTVEHAPSGVVATITLRDSMGRAVDLFHLPGDSADVPAWASAAAHAIITRITPDRAHDFAQYSGGARLGSALRLYYEGRHAFERQDWAGAEARFRDAIALDTSFAQARWWVFQARKWARQPFTDELAALAAISTIPPPLDALLRLQQETDLSRRLAGLDALAAAWPGAPDVHLARANELFHRGPLVGRPLDEALSALELAARTFPSLDQPVVWDQVVWGAVRSGEEARARAALHARQRSAAPGDPWGPVLRYAVEARFRPWIGKMLALGLRFTDDDARTQLRTAHRLGVLFDLPKSQEALGAWLTPSDDAEGIASVLSGRAVARVMQGRPEAALASLDSAVAHRPGDTELAIQRLEWRLLLPTLGVHLASEDSREGRAMLLANASRLPARGAFALAMDAYRQRDTAALARYHDRLMEVTGGSGLAPAVTLAILHDVRGDRITALDLLRHRFRDETDTEVRARGPFVRAVAAVIHGELLLAAGDSVGAVAAWEWADNADIRGWPVGAPQEGEIDAAVSPTVHWRRGDLLLRLGQVDTGCHLQSRALALWSAAEPIFRADFMARHSTMGAVTCRA